MKKNRLDGEFIYFVQLIAEKVSDQLKEQDAISIGLFANSTLAEKARDEYIRDIDASYSNEDFTIYRLPIQTSDSAPDFGLNFYYNN